MIGLCAALAGCAGAKPGLRGEAGGAKEASADGRDLPALREKLRALRARVGGSGVKTDAATLRDLGWAELLTGESAAGLKSLAAAREKDPGDARTLLGLALFAHDRGATAEARALADRLTHDPFLGEAVHRMLTRIAAIRSAAEILSDYPDVQEERRDEFMAMIGDESRALTEVAEALAAYFDKAQEAGRALTPLDEVEALFEARSGRFALLRSASCFASSGLEAKEMIPQPSTTTWSATPTLVTTVPSGQITSSNSAFAPSQLPQCLAERQALGSGTVTVITARGFSPDYERDASTQFTVRGAAVWLQSMLTF